MQNTLNHLSYSSISMYLDCPEKWRRKYLAGEKTKSGTALAFGSAFHGTVEHLVTHPEAQADSLPTWTEQFEKAFTQDTYLELGETREEFFNEGIRMLGNEAIQQQIRKIQPRHDIAGPMIERKIELRVPGVEIPIIGYIDVVLQDGTPADFKTSAKSWSENQASASLQTLFYLAAMNQMGWPVNWKFQHIVFVKTKTPQVQVLEHSHKPAELFFLFDVIRRVWQGIEREVFPLNPTGWSCSEKWCDFYANCKGKYLEG